MTELVMVSGEQPPVSLSEKAQGGRWRYFCEGDEPLIPGTFFFILYNGKWATHWTPYRREEPVGLTGLRRGGTAARSKVQNHSSNFQINESKSSLTQNQTRARG